LNITVFTVVFLTLIYSTDIRATYFFVSLLSLLSSVPTLCIIFFDIFYTFLYGYKWHPVKLRQIQTSISSVRLAEAASVSSLRLPSTTTKPASKGYPSVSGPVSPLPKNLLRRNDKK
jgi:hypothetical protein